MARTSCQVVILPHEVKVQVYNSVDQKKCPMEDFGEFGVVRVKAH